MKTAMTVAALMTLMLNLFSSNASASAFCREVRDQAPVCQR
jgi:hypothetical protein